MSSSAALLQFAAEFALFLAATAGVGSLLGGDRGSRRGLPRLAAVAGFLALAVSAVVRGSDLAGEADTAEVVGLRAVGVLLLLVESARAPLRPRARAALWAGLALLVGAGVADVADEATATALLLAVGALLLGLSVVLAGQRSIASRVSTSAAGILLVVVLVLGVGLSAVLVATVQDGVVDRLDRRAGNEAAGAQDAAAQLAGSARIVAGTLGGDGPLRPVIERLADQAVASDTLSASLAQLSETFLEDASLAFVSRRGASQGAVNLTTAQVVALTGSEVVREALASGAPRNAVEVVAGDALAIRVQPVPLAGGPPLFGVAVAARPLDRTYLERAAQDDRDLSLALVSPNQVLASFGPVVGPEAVRRTVADALADGVTSRTVGNRFVSVAPVDQGDGDSSVAVVASYPTALVADARDDLFRILFLIALAVTVVALGLSSLVGSRIGDRLRRLTEAARSIRRGDVAVQTGITSDDEIGVLGVTFDAMARSVAEKTDAEAALRRRLEAVVAGMGEALVAVGTDGRITDFNPAAERLLGVPAPDARGRPVEEVVRLYDDQDRSLAGDLQPRQPWRGRGHVAVRGVKVPVIVSVGTLDLPGIDGGGGRVVNLRDLRAEEQLEKVKTELLSRFSHEYRTALTPIMGFAQKLADGPVAPESVREWGATIFERSEALERLVRMQEFYAQKAAGRMDVAKEWVAPEKLVEDALQRRVPRLRRAGTITRRVDRGLPHVFQDEKIIGDCLDELIDNADKFSAEGGRITVRATTTTGGVELSVKDNGIGMTPDEQERAFQRFDQADTSDTRTYGGLGLGLPFVQEAVEALGGEVRCESAPGSGSKLSIVLPAPPRGGPR